MSCLSIRSRSLDMIRRWDDVKELSKARGDEEEEKCREVQVSQFMLEKPEARATTQVLLPHALFCQPWQLTSTHQQIHLPTIGSRFLLQEAV